MKSCKFSGGYDEMVTPVPIPNTEVKHLSADNTWLETARESKSLPDLYQDPKLNGLGFCVMCGCFNLILITLHLCKIIFLKIQKYSLRKTLDMVIKINEYNKDIGQRTS